GVALQNREGATAYGAHTTYTHFDRFQTRNPTELPLLHIGFRPPFRRFYLLAFASSARCWAGFEPCSSLPLAKQTAGVPCTPRREPRLYCSATGSSQLAALTRLPCLALVMAVCLSSAHQTDCMVRAVALCKPARGKAA